MAYYTVAHYFHSSKTGELNLSGRLENEYGIQPSMVSYKTWDYLFLGQGTSSDSGLPQDVAERMRNEFKYWYPVDLRVSGKELIQNHLTMFLYNHAAIWPKDSSTWPRSIYCNGHVLVDSEKMSKNKGNFITLHDALNKYTVDATRLALADAGDGLDDPNFVTDSAKGFVLKLFTLLEKFKEYSLESMRTGDYNTFDKIFDNAINSSIMLTDKHYKEMSFRQALNTVFFELPKDESFYTLATSGVNMHREIIIKYMETVSLLLSPIIPHTSEHIWINILHKNKSIMEASFPTIHTIDVKLTIKGQLIQEAITEIRLQAMKYSKRKVKVEHAVVYYRPVYHPWQIAGIEVLRKIYDDNNKSFPPNTTSIINTPDAPWLKLNQNVKEFMSFIAFTRILVQKYGESAFSLTPLVDELSTFTEALSFIQDHSGVSHVEFLDSNVETYPKHSQARVKARPLQPSVSIVINN